MSWDVMLIKLEAPPRDDTELEPMALGHPAIVSRRISKAWPRTVWSGVEGRLQQDGCDLEIEVTGDDLPDHATMVHVRIRGAGDPMPLLRALCEPNGWLVFDSQAGEFLDLDEPRLAHGMSNAALGKILGPRFVAELLDLSRKDR